MPNFYAKKILANGSFCLSPSEDWWLSPIYSWTGACKSIKKYDLEYDSDGNPTIASCQKNNFAWYYNSPEALTLFRAIYNNDFGMKDAYTNYWAVVSKRLSSNKYVLGYDPFNEPLFSFKGFSELLYELTFGHFDSTELAPLYTKFFDKY